jgi:hypothetical protein
MSWEEVKQRLAEAKTPAERRAAAEALASHIPPEEQGMHLVSMQKGGVNVVKLGDLPAAMEDPRVYSKVTKIVTGG